MIVVYRRQDNLWKIAELDLASQGGKSDFLRSTNDIRGVRGYRAPEIIKGRQYTKKADIWALGCIFYEIFSHQRAFGDDFEVYMLIMGDRKHIEFPKSSSLGVHGMFVIQCFRDMLQLTPQERPSAQALLQRFRHHKSLYFDDFEYEEEKATSNRGLLDTPVGTFLKNECGEIMASIWSREGLVGTRDASWVNQGHDSTLLCRCLIGGGGEGFVYEVRHQILYRLTSRW